jgi:outer membrane protein assembly factor BamB
MAFALWLTCMVGPALHGEDWPGWRGPRGDGSWNGPELPDSWPKDGLRLCWRKAIGGGFAGVTVAGGRVFVMDRQTEPVECERVICLDARTGDSIWSDRYPVAYGKLDYGTGPRAAATVFDGRVYTLGAVGHVRCLDAVTGKRLWSKDMVREHRARVPEWGFAASPVIVDDLVVVHAGGEPDGCYTAFDRRDGTLVWHSQPDPAGYATPILIDAPSGRQLVCWTPLAVLGLDPFTGKRLWGVPYQATYGVSIATPIYREGIVFVSGYWEGSKAIRLGPKATDATLIWEDNRHLRGLMSQPLYRSGHVYSLDKQFGLTCFELAGGKKIWDDDNRMTPRGRNPQATMVWLNGTSRVLVLNSEGELILARFEPSGYQEQSRTRLLGPTWAHPAYAGDCVYARSDTEIVCAALLGDPPRSR